ncbi:MAG: HD domain-containing protein [Candidatus Altiarchaeota archaeon]
MSEKVVRDPIHGNIRLDGAFLGLLDTPQMQRLRNIKQNGLCYLVYPAMNSTRFEHSLGVFHLGGSISEHLQLDESDEMELKAACLLHDVGHGPFSHTFDELMLRHGFDHEGESARIINETEISDMMGKAGIKPKAVVELIYGRGKLGKLLSSEVDVDKMDYLVRDAYYAGVAYGVTDVERLLYSIRFEKGDVLVESGGLEAAESLLINRNMMYQTVYRHHAKRIAESMMTHALGRLIEDGSDPIALARMDDIGLISKMRMSTGYAQDMMARLDCRRLFKNAYSENIHLLTEESKKELAENTVAIEAKMAKEHGIDEGYLLLDYPETSMNEYRVKVKTPHGLKSISEVSQLAKSLEGSEKEKLTVNIYVRPQDRQKLSEFSPEDYFTYKQTRISGFI